MKPDISTIKYDKTGIERIWSVFEALGGDRRGWHPYYSVNSLSDNSLSIPDPRPENKVESWERPPLQDYTEKIGETVENYLEETYDMERINDGPVDLRVTEGPFEGSPVQAKSAAVIVSRGRRSDGSWYSSPGGIYMRERSITKLLDPGESYGEDPLLHTVVHYPKSGFDTKLETPVREVCDGTEENREPVKTALVGELVLPVEQVLEEVSFNNGKRKACYWDWPEAYGRRPDTSETVEKWYEDTFLTEKTRDY